MRLPLPPGFEARGNPAPDRRMSVYRDGDLVGRYWRRHRARGYRWESMNGGHGDTSTAHLAIAAIMEMAMRDRSDPS